MRRMMRRAYSASNLKTLRISSPPAASSRVNMWVNWSSWVPVSRWTGQVTRCHVVR